MVISAKNKKSGKEYFLHSVKNKKTGVTLFFFSSKKAGALSSIPKNRKIVYSPKTGLPLLKKK